MVSLVIFLLTSICGGAAGFAAADALKKKYSYIEQIMNALEQMLELIRYNRMKLSGIFTQISKEKGFFISDDLIAAADSGIGLKEEWDKCVQSLLYLQNDDKAPLYDLGDSLGRSDAEGQTAVINMTLERLSHRADSAREEYERRGRLYRTLGILCGAAAGIILI